MTQRHYRGHSKQDAYVCSSMAKTPQGTAPTVLALFKQHGLKAKKKKKKVKPTKFVFWSLFSPLVPLNGIPLPNSGTLKSNAFPHHLP